MRSVDLVIFDCDGVIADSEVISATLLVRQLLPYGIRIDADYVFRNFVGKSFPIVADIIGERFGVALPNTFVGDYRAALKEAFAASLQPTPGFLDVLGQLTCPACVATSSSAPRVAHTLEALGLTDHFGADVFTASQVANGKPAPDLFLFAAHAMSTTAGALPGDRGQRCGDRSGAGGRHDRLALRGRIAHRRYRAHPRRDAGGVTVFDNWDRFYVLAPELRA